MKWIRISLNAWIIIGLGTMLILGVPIFLYWAWASYYSWDRDHWNQDKIASAYVSYYAHTKTFPTSLDDLVNSGYLPKKADWYKEPPGFLSRAVDYRTGSYVVNPPRSGEVKEYNMIGRKVQRNGKDEIDYDGVANSEICGGILLLQGK
jgi:hypothetical protein